MWRLLKTEGAREKSVISVENRWPKSFIFFSCTAITEIIIRSFTILCSYNSLIAVKVVDSDVTGWIPRPTVDLQEVKR